MAGFGPMNAASMASAFSASTASGPALNVAPFRVTSAPSALANRPCSNPTRAGAWVTFGKYPSRRVTVPLVVPAAAAVADEPPVLDDPQAAATRPRPAARRMGRDRRMVAEAPT